MPDEPCVEFWNPSQQKFKVCIETKIESCRPVPGQLSSKVNLSDEDEVIRSWQHWPHVLRARASHWVMPSRRNVKDSKSVQIMACRESEHGESLNPPQPMFLRGRDAEVDDRKRPARLQRRSWEGTPKPPEPRPTVGGKVAVLRQLFDEDCKISSGTVVWKFC